MQVLQAASAYLVSEAEVVPPPKSRACRRGGRWVGLCQRCVSDPFEPRFSHLLVRPRGAPTTTAAGLQTRAKEAQPA